MTILVTGGAGFIGSHYVRFKLEQGDSVIVLDDFSNSSGLEQLESLACPNLKVVQGTICDSSLVHELALMSSAIVNFAAWTHNDTSISSPEAFLDSNTKGVFILLEVAKRLDLRFYQVSTDEVFGDLPIGSAEKFNEMSPYRPSSPYSASKAAGDLLVGAWSRTYGVRATLTYSTNNYGEFQHPEKFIPRQITRLLSGQNLEIYGDGSNFREWVNVSENVKAIDKVLERGRPGSSYCIGSGFRYSNLEVAQALLEIFGLDDSWLEFVNDRPGHDKGYAVDTSRFISDFKTRPATRDLMNDLPELIDWYRTHSRWWEGLIT